ncbi:RHS repeat domain-containing protein [Facilibium subflavum]|uniref:RHS repeat domain-containing protein n=1 Tax=Facilibium subflavum TaxID=2219058 RepID=UPI000E65DC8E|nr:RHS repeat-associated core domain-containing protein [Facilibium subflavum]
MQRYCLFFVTLPLICLVPSVFYACHIRYDDNGNMIQDVLCNLYAYNAQNALISFKHKAAQKTVLFRYNAEGLLESKTIASKQRLYIYSADGKLINSLIKTQALASAYLAKDVRIVMDNHITKQQYLVSGALGTNFLQLNTHSGISQHFNYQSFGELADFAGSDARDGEKGFNALPLLYHGQYQDITTGLIYLHARFYNPGLMRFMQRDSYHFMNRYSFTDDNPINNTDPSGHMSLGLIDMIAGTGFALATSVATALTPEFSYLTASFFMAGNSAPAGIDMSIDFFHHKFLSGTANALLMLSGIAGSVSAQPQMVLKEARQLANNGPKLTKEIETYRYWSAVSSSILAGAASGLTNPYMSKHNGGIYSSAAISATAGFASGKFYDYLNGLLGKSKVIWKNVLLGSIRSGISGIISASPVLITQGLKGKLTAEDGVSQGIPFLFGGISGVSQNYLTEAYEGKNSVRLAGASMFRTSYLFIKPPIANAVSSGTLNTLFNS